MTAAKVLPAHPLKRWPQFDLDSASVQGGPSAPDLARVCAPAAFNKEATANLQSKLAPLISSVALEALE
jgi:hypothetical protein